MMPKTITAEDMALIKEQEWLRITEAAILTRKSRKTIYDAIYAGKLNHVTNKQRYYVNRSDLDAWMLSGAPT